MYKYFKLSEFDSPDEPGSGDMMEPAVVLALDNARDIAGFPFVVTSGFRSIAHNRSLIRAGLPASAKSSHLLGWAVDLRVDNAERAYLMVEALLDAGFNRIGVSEKFIHADMDPNKNPNRLWTY